MAAVNQAYVFTWDLANVDGGPYTGLSGTMTATLNRTADGSTITSASESVVIAEIGATSFYTFTYTPLFTQYYILHVSESTNVLDVSDGIQVSGAIGATDTNAYCSESDVIAHVQMGDYTANTNPTENQVLGFMENRAAALYAVMSDILGDETPGPASGDYSVQIGTSPDSTLALSKVLRQANAAGAAADTLQAAGAGEASARSERVVEMEQLYATLVVDYVIPAAKAVFKATTTRAGTHISAGEVSEPSVVSRERAALPFNDTTRF